MRSALINAIIALERIAQILSNSFFYWQTLGRASGVFGGVLVIGIVAFVGELRVSHSISLILLACTSSNISGLAGWLVGRSIKVSLVSYENCETPGSQCIKSVTYPSHTFGLVSFSIHSSIHPLHHYTITLKLSLGLFGWFSVKKVVQNLTLISSNITMH